MDLSSVFTALKAHATTAITGLGSGWDVDIAPPLPRGRTVRLFYGGEREVEHYGEGNTLSTKMVGQAVIIRAFWPVADYAKDRRRNLMLDMAAYAKALRTAVQGDFTLGGACTSLALALADPDDILFGTVHYAIVDSEVIVEYDEFTWSE